MTIITEQWQFSPLTLAHKELPKSQDVTSSYSYMLISTLSTLFLLGQQSELFI